MNRFRHRGNPRTLPLRAVLALVVLTTAALPAAAQVFKCQGQGGKLVYQNTPCPTDHRESRPTIVGAPTLTDEEKFRADAYAAGITPAEARRRAAARDHAAPDVSAGPGARSSGAAPVYTPAPDRSGSAECAKARRNLEIARSSVTRSRQDRLDEVASLTSEMKIVCHGPPAQAAPRGYASPRPEPRPAGFATR